MSTRRHSSGKPALDLLEEAVHLLRRAPARIFLRYYIGALPFILALLYFWADMSRSAFAHERVVPASCLLALLFVWMKFWHTAFCSSLRESLTGEPAGRWDFRRCFHAVSVQAALQPLALFIRPLAALITVPYVWVFAFFQNLLVLGDDATAGMGAVSKRAAAEAKLWPAEHHLAQGVLALFGVFVWINVVAGMFAIPFLLKSLFGVETTFTRSWAALANSTFLAASFAGAYLCVNPLTQAFYVLRCFYGESLRTGQDLRVELSRIQRHAASAIVVVLFFASLAPCAVAQSPAPESVEAARLNQAIEEVLTRREYAWRMPRELIPKDERSVLGDFFAGMIKTAIAWMQPVKRLIKQVIEWIDNYMRSRRPAEMDEHTGRAWLRSLRWLFIALTAATAAALCFLIWNRWKRGERRPQAVPEAMPAEPDLHAEDLTADLLPEDGWMQLAREMRERGQLRLALRALFLAGLAHLGSRNLLVLAKHKSNRDYDRDLRRRARTQGELAAIFGENKDAFERAWYGRHEVRDETLSRFSENLEKIRAC